MNEGLYKLIILHHLNYYYKLNANHIFPPLALSNSGYKGRNSTVSSQTKY